MPPHLLPVLVSILGFVPIPHSQDPGSGAVVSSLPQAISEIQAIREDRNGDLIPDRLGETIEIEGLVTSGVYEAGGADQIRAYVADRTGGVRLLLPSSLGGRPFEQWDSVRIGGVVGQYKAMPHIEVSEIEVLGHADPILPSDHFAGGLNGEAFVGDLVRLQGEIAWGEDRVFLRDRTGSLRVYLRSAVLPQERVHERFLPGRIATVVGILEQNDSREPLDSGYRITPRTIDDIRLLPPDRGWMIWGSFLALAVLAGVVSWLRYWVAKRDSVKWRDHSLRLQEEIKDRELAEEARKVMETRVQEGQKLETVGRMAGGIAHEFNNLLAVILGNASLELEQGDLPEGLRKSWAEVSESAARGAELTRQLLAFSQRQTNDPVPLELRSFLEEKFSALQRILGEGIRLEVDAESGTWVELDPGLLDSALLALVQNAKDAMGEEGILSISCRVIRPPELGALDSTVPPGEYAYLSLQDTGTGMDPETLARAFEPFFTTKEFGAARGLGLSTVHGFVTQSGGFITAESADGVGSIVRILFPIATVEALGAD